jgi:hypothetical protein
VITIPSAPTIEILFIASFSGVTFILANSSINSTRLSAGLSSLSAVSVCICSSSHDKRLDRFVYQCLLVMISTFLALGFQGSF